MEEDKNLPPIYRQVLWVKYLPDVTIETQVIYVLIEDHSDIDVDQTLYSMWTYDSDWHLLGGASNIAITITQEQYDLLVINNALHAGQTYVITDLTFNYKIGGTQVWSSYTEPLLVTALTSNTLLPVAYPINHPNDWVEVDWGVPAITFRHDSLLNNHVGYDYRNKLNRRYKLNVTNIFKPSGIFDDWFLPSIDALLEIQKLVANNTVTYPDVYYWSSTEDVGDTINRACCLQLNATSVAEVNDKSQMLAILPIRSFNVIEELPSYTIGDIGPSRGYIFYVIAEPDDSFTYYEVSNTPFDSNIWSDVLVETLTSSAIIESENNTTTIINVFGSTDSAALDCKNYIYTSGYVIGDIVVDEFDRIYIAIEDNNSISLDDGLWYLLPVVNNTYQGIANMGITLYGELHEIPISYTDYLDVLTFTNTCENITTGFNFINNTFNGIDDSIFGNDFTNNVNLQCSGLKIGNSVSHLILNTCEDITIDNSNSNVLMFGCSNVAINIYNRGIYLSNSTSNVKIGQGCSNLLSTHSISDSTFGNGCSQLYGTSFINNLTVKNNINLVFLEQVVLDILQTNYNKTIETMYDSTVTTKQVLWYFDANSSLPIFVELIQGN